MKKLLTLAAVATMLTLIALGSSQVLAKALDRKQGKPVWVPFGRKEVV